MSLTRNFLKGMGLNEEQIGAIIDEHVDTVNSLKADRDKYKTDAEKLAGVQKELDDIKEKGDGGWQKKYEDEHTAFEAYKTAQTAKETKSAKETAYTDLLKEAGITEKAHKLILKATDFEAMELDKDGKTLKDAKKMVESIKTEYADYVTEVAGKGADVNNPNGNNNSKFSEMSLGDKMTYANAHPNAPEVQAWLNAE